MSGGSAGVARTLFANQFAEVDARGLTTQSNLFNQTRPLDLIKPETTSQGLDGPTVLRHPSGSRIGGERRVKIGWDVSQVQRRHALTVSKEAAFLQALAHPDQAHLSPGSDRDAPRPRRSDRTQGSGPAPAALLPPGGQEGSNSGGPVGSVSE